MTTFNVNIRERVVIPLTVRPKVTFTLTERGSALGMPGSPGLSAYQIWLSQGNSGTEQDFLDSLVGAPGTNGFDGEDGVDGVTPNIGVNNNWWINGVDTGVRAVGQDGQDGVGITSVTLTSTVGLVKTYTILFTNLTTTTFTVTDGEDGEDGLSSYQIWLNQGNSGSEQDFLNSIKGEPGQDSVVPGPKGNDGYTPVKGVDYFDGEDGESAYEIWLSQGNIGTEEDFLNSIKGEPGESGSSVSSGYLHDGRVSNRNINIISSGFVPVFKQIIRVIPDSSIADGSAITLSINGGTPVELLNYTEHDDQYGLVLVYLVAYWGVISREAEKYTIKGNNTGDETRETIKSKLGAATSTTDGYVTASQISKLDGIEAGAEVNNISDANAASLTSGESNTLHSHPLPAHTHDYAPALGADDNYVTDAEKTVIANTSGINSGDNATNTQYSGLAASKADVNNVLTLNNTTAFTPDADYEPATKKYVDDIVNTKAPLLSRSSAFTIESDFFSTNASAACPGLLGAATSSGTVGVVAGSVDHPGVIYLRDSTTANGNYRFLSDVSAFKISGSETAIFVFQARSARATASFRLGFQDSAAIQTQPTDGVWFEGVGNGTDVNFFGRCKNNAGPSTTETYVMALNTWYTGKIEVNVDATLVTFTLYAENGTQLWQQTVNTNIPTAVGRETGFGIIAGETSNDAAADILHIDYLRMEINRTLVR
jgi:hypothetical protein